jgi:hypothetical protein
MVGIPLTAEFPDVVIVAPGELYSWKASRNRLFKRGSLRLSLSILSA